jgi:hypothetical protein
VSDYFVAATKHTPEIDFRYSQHRLSIKGECFPENAVMYFGNLLDRTRAYLASLNGTDVTIDIHLTYFNSASTKLLFKLIGEFDAASAKGNYCTLNWMYDEEDDTLEEFGRDLIDEYTSLRVETVATSAM